MSEYKMSPSVKVVYKIPNFPKLRCNLRERESNDVERMMLDRSRIARARGFVLCATYASYSYYYIFLIKTGIKQFSNGRNWSPVY